MLTSDIDEVMLSGEGGASRQAESLRGEGVEVERSALGEFSIDFSTYGWFPDQLPSEEEEDDADEGEHDA